MEPLNAVRAVGRSIPVGWDVLPGHEQLVFKE